MKKIVSKSTIISALLSGLIFTLAYPIPSFNAQATTYKWVDQNNKTNYSNTKPDTANFETVAPASKASSSAPAEIQKLKAQQQAETQQEQQGAVSPEDAAKQKENADAMAKNCDLARNKLGALIEHPRVRKAGTNGEMEMMTQPELEAAIKQTQEDVEKYCGPKLPS